MIEFGVGEVVILEPDFDCIEGSQSAVQCKFRDLCLSQVCPHYYRDFGVCVWKDPGVSAAGAGGGGGGGGFNGL